MSRTTSILLKYVLPFVVIAGAATLTAGLILSREAPSQSEPERASAVVRTQTVERRRHRLDVRASGTVEPSRQVQILPEVNGRVVEVHENLEPGGVVEEGDTLVRIDPTDYRLAVKQRKTALEQAKSQLSLEQGQQKVAKREWNLFKKKAGDLAESGNPKLALRKPQLANARAQVRAAKTQLQQAEENLRRTRVRAPFDAVVRQQSVSVGDIAGGQNPLATLAATEAFWVKLKVSPSKIPYIGIPSVNASEGSKVHIEYDTGETTVEREGRVLRLAGGLDRAGRLAQIIVRVEDPFGVEDREDDSDLRGVPILLDSYVDARIIGHRHERVVELPRSAVRNGNQAYLFDDGTLEIRKLEIIWRRPESVLVESGVEDGERVVVGPMPNPIEGMPLTRAADENTASGANSGADAAAAGDDAADDDEMGPADAGQEPSPDAARRGGEE